MDRLLTVIILKLNKVSDENPDNFEMFSWKVGLKLKNLDMLPSRPLLKNQKNLYKCNYFQ